MTKPISVVITSYNQKRYLVDALKSIINQTITPEEVIVCDDCSTDGSQKLIKKYANKHSNIRYIFQDDNVGVVKNRNTGLREARNPYISILDGDDWYSGNKLELEYNALKQWNYGWAYSLEKIADSNGNFQRSRLGISDGKSGDIFKEIVTKELSPKHWMMKKEALESVGFLDEDMDLYEDWEFKIRLSHNYDAYFSADSAIYYRQHESGLHNASDAKYRKEKRKLYNKVLKQKRDMLPRIDEIESEVKKFFYKDYREVAEEQLW